MTINFRNHDPDPTIRPMIVSKSTIFRARKKGPIPSGTSIINFVGDHNGVSVLSNLPYLPTNLTWKGKDSITQSQLEMQNRLKNYETEAKKRATMIYLVEESFYYVSWVLNYCL